MIQDDKYSISTSIYSISTSMFKSILSSKYWCSNYDAGEQISWLKYYGGVEGGLDVFNLSLKSGLVNFIISRGILQVHGIFSSWLYKGLQLIVLTDFIPCSSAIETKKRSNRFKKVTIGGGVSPIWYILFGHSKSHSESLVCNLLKKPISQRAPSFGGIFPLI